MKELSLPRQTQARGAQPSAAKEENNLKGVTNYSNSQELFQVKNSLWETDPDICKTAFLSASPNWTGLNPATYVPHREKYTRQHFQR